MVLKYHISPSAIDEDFVIYVYEASNTNPGAHVDTLVVPKGPGPGHPNPATITFNGLDKVVHVVRMYSAVTVALLHEYNVEPTTDIVTIFDPIQFKIGDGQPNTPAAGQPTATTPELAGLNTLDFLIFRNNYGILHPGIHFDFDSGTGTWNLIQDGDIFNGPPDSGGEEFTIIMKPSVVSTVVNDSVVGKWFGGFVDLAANTTYNAAHLRKLIRHTGTHWYEYDVDPPIGYGYTHINLGAAAHVLTIKFTNKPLLWVDGTTKATLDLKPKQHAMFTFDGDNWNVVFLVDAAFADNPAIAAGTILKAGMQYQGDIPGGDPPITINHNAAISGDYICMFTLKNNNTGTYYTNNKVCHSWHHHPTDKPNKVIFTPQEISGEGQDVTICYILIKV